MMRLSTVDGATQLNDIQQRAKQAEEVTRSAKSQAEEKAQQNAM